MACKLFGAALDALDDPVRVDLKQAYIQACQAGHIPVDLPLDPFDAISPMVANSCQNTVSIAGKLELPDWLTPRPSTVDVSLVHPARYRSFIDNDELGDYIEACARFVVSNILPDHPCMIAVDHAMSAGPLKALAQHYSPHETTVVIIDSHFDALPSQLRGPPEINAPQCGPRNCGSFLSSLLDDGIVIPENLFIVGVSDYPTKNTTELYNQAYQAFIDQGVTVIPRVEAEKATFLDEFEKKLTKNSGRRIYVSLDADAGACTCMNAVRFLDTKGLQEKTIIGLANLLKKLINSRRFELVGLDIAEVDVHFLHLNAIQDRPDKTDHICAEFINLILQE